MRKAPLLFGLIGASLLAGCEISSPNRDPNGYLPPRNSLISYTVHLNSDKFPEMSRFKSEAADCAAFVDRGDQGNVFIVTPQQGVSSVQASGTRFSFTGTTLLLSKGRVNCLPTDKLEEAKKHLAANSTSWLEEFGGKALHFSFHNDKDTHTQIYFYFVPKEEMTPEVLAFLKSKKAYFITKEGHGQKMYEPNLSWKYIPEILPNPVPVAFRGD